MRDFQFRKSSYSGTNNDCVEAAVTSDKTHVRDSKAPDTGGLVVGGITWAGFLDTIRADGFKR